MDLDVSTKCTTFDVGTRQESGGHQDEDDSSISSGDGNGSTFLNNWLTFINQKYLEKKHLNVIFPM